MSASDKKKLRKEQETAMLTQKQKEEQAEAKKLKIYTFTFVGVLALIVCIAVVALGFNVYKQSGIAEKSTVAAVIDDTKLNSVEMNYYYKDAINEMYNSVYSSMGSMGNEYVDMYLEAMGLELATPLDEQEHPEGGTWAEFFVKQALDTAKSDFAMYNLAKEAGYVLDEEKQTTLDNQLSNLSSTATLYGYTSANQYLQAIYGHGANTKSYGAYLERSTIASAYYTHYFDGLTYDDAAIRAHEKENAADYNSYDYAYSYLSYNDFITGGTEDENGTKTYTDEEKDAARAKAKEAAEKLVTATSVEELEKMVEEVEVNETSGLAVNTGVSVLASQVENADMATWLGDEARTEGEFGIIANTTSGDEGIVNGYYVVCFQGKTDNTRPMANVRHLLVQFEGGTTDDSTGETVYTDEEKALASTEAKSLLEKWESGEKTEERFIEMVKEYSDDSSAADGGLFENINPDSEYVPTFLSWSIDESRKAGDYGLIESPYGGHLMFYVGDSEISYRDHMISEELKAADIEEWYNGAIDAVKAETKDLSKLELDLVLNPEHEHDHDHDHEDEAEDEAEEETEDDSEEVTE